MTGAKIFYGVYLTEGNEEAELRKLGLLPNLPEGEEDYWFNTYMEDLEDSLPRGLVSGICGEHNTYRFYIAAGFQISVSRECSFDISELPEIPAEELILRDYAHTLGLPPPSWRVAVEGW